MEKDGTFEVLPKKEVIELKKEYEKLNKLLMMLFGLFLVVSLASCGTKEVTPTPTNPVIEPTEELTRIEELLKTANFGQMLGLSLAMTVVPIILLLASYVIIKKKYIIDEKLYDQMVTEIQARKEVKTNE